jgi:hypothetical protein
LLGEALIVLALWLLWLSVLSCCSPAFFLAATWCSSSQWLGGWQAFYRDLMA